MDNWQHLCHCNKCNLFATQHLNADSEYLLRYIDIDFSIMYVAPNEELFILQNLEKKKKMLENVKRT